LQGLAARGQLASNALAAPFVGKSSRSNVQRGVLLCGLGYWRKNAPEKPLVGVVLFPRANWRRAMVKYSCCAQWIARKDDFLSIHAHAGAAN
jgi:hypothetical protein